jgi:plastocyanin
MGTATASPTDDELAGKPAYTRLGVFGIALIAFALVMFGVVALLQAPEQLPFMGAVLALLTVVGGAAWRFGTWAKVVAIVVALLAAVAMHWAVFGLPYPASPVDFLPGLLVPLGVAFAIGGNVAAIRYRKRPVPGPQPLERRLMAGTLAVLLVAAVGSGVMALTSRSSVELADGGIPVDIAAFEFPDLVEASVGDRLVVHNSDAAVHDFAVPALGLKEVVLPGNDGLIDLVGAAPGNYTVYCTLHSNTSDPDPQTAGMATTLIVSGS